MRSPSAGSPPSGALYEAQRAERRYRAVDAENRLVARGLESKWKQRLRELERAKAELARRERERPRALSAEDRRRLLALGADSYGKRRPPRLAIARNCCERCSKRSS
jgi:hypothetical protein